MSEQVIHINGRTVPVRDVETVSRELDVEPGEKITVHIESIATPNERGAALVEVQALDGEGEVVGLDSGVAYSDKAGYFFYLSVSADDDGIAATKAELTVPDGAEKLRLIGRPWKRGASAVVLDDFIVFSDRQEIDSARTLPSGAFLPQQAWGFTHEQVIPENADNLVISGTASTPSEKSSVILTVHFKDASGNLLLPAANRPVNAKHGAFLLIESKDGPGPFEFEGTVEVPPHASEVTLRVAEGWGDSRLVLTGPVNVSPEDRDTEDLDSFLQSIPDDAPLLVIDTTAPPMGHETLSLRPNNLARAYSRLGIWVIFLPFSKLQGFPRRVSERIFQIPRAETGELGSILLRHRRLGRNTYICSSYPSIQANCLATLLKTNGWQIVYEVRDDMEEFNRVGYSKWYSVPLERSMLRIADKVLSVSPALDAKLRMLEQGTAEFMVNPNAVNRVVIDAGEKLREPAAHAARNSSRVVGYVGHLTESWFDWPLVIAGAKRLPDVEFEIVGHGAPSGLDLPENVHLLGPKTHDELPALVQRWKVGLIPFLDIPLTRSVDPNKIYEYFAWGLRVVSAPMGSVESLPSTLVYRNEDEYVEAIKSSLATDMGAEEAAAIEATVQVSDWDRRALECAEFFGIEVGHDAV